MQFCVILKPVYTLSAPFFCCLPPQSLPISLLISVRGEKEEEEEVLSDTEKEGSKPFITHPMTISCPSAQLSSGNAQRTSGVTSKNVKWQFRDRNRVPMKQNQTVAELMKKGLNKEEASELCLTVSLQAKKGEQSSVTDRLNYERYSCVGRNVRLMSQKDRIQHGKQNHALRSLLLKQGDQTFPQGSKSQQTLRTAKLNHTSIFRKS